MHIPIFSCCVWMLRVHTKFSALCCDSLSHRCVLLWGFQCVWINCLEMSGWAAVWLMRDCVSDCYVTSCCIKEAKQKIVPVVPVSSIVDCRHIAHGLCTRCVWEKKARTPAIQHCFCPQSQSANRQREPRKRQKVCVREREREKVRESERIKTHDK